MCAAWDKDPYYLYAPSDSDIEIHFGIQGGLCVLSSKNDGSSISATTVPKFTSDLGSEVHLPKRPFLDYLLGSSSSIDVSSDNRW